MEGWAGTQQVSALDRGEGITIRYFVVGEEK